MGRRIRQPEVDLLLDRVCVLVLIYQDELDRRPARFRFTSKELLPFGRVEELEEYALEVSEIAAVLTF